MSISVEAVDAGTASTEALSIKDQFGGAFTLTAATPTTAAAMTIGTVHTGTGAPKIQIDTNNKIQITNGTNDKSGDTYTYTFLGKTITVTSTGNDLATWTYGVQ